jgi:hypothetical protein
MPEPALPVPVDVDQPGPATGNFTRTYRDLAGRPYTGRVTVRQTVKPFKSAEADLTDGRVTFQLPGGAYTVKAMLRDPDGVRAFMAEDIDIRDQEGS